MFEICIYKKTGPEVFFELALFYFELALLSLNRPALTKQHSFGCFFRHLKVWWEIYPLWAAMERHVIRPLRYDMGHLVIDQENIRQDIHHLVSDLAPNERLWRCSNVGLLFCFSFFWKWLPEWYPVWSCYVS